MTEMNFGIRDKIGIFKNCDFLKENQISSDSDILITKTGEL